MALDPFASPEDYTTAYGATTARTEDDLNAASQAIRDDCGWHIWPLLEDQEITLDGDGTNLIRLRTLKLVGVSSLTERKRGRGQVAETVDPAELDWSEAGLIWHDSGRCWTPRPRGIVVTIDHGYEELPASIKQLTLTLARRAAYNSSGQIVIQRSVGARSESYAQDTTASEAEVNMLNPYRIVR